jgi:hypothetical protein
MKPDVIEIYLGNARHPFASAQSSFAPDAGDLINIEQVTYRVVGRSFTIDHADDAAERQVRCNVIVERVGAHS